MSDLRARETEGPAQHERRLAALEGRTAAEASDATEPDLRRQQRLKAGRDGQSWRRFVHQAFALTCWLLAKAPGAALAGSRLRARRKNLLPWPPKVQNQEQYKGSAFRLIYVSNRYQFEPYF